MSGEFTEREMDRLVAEVADQRKKANYWRENFCKGVKEKVKYRKERDEAMAKIVIDTQEWLEVNQLIEGLKEQKVFIHEDLVGTERMLKESQGSVGRLKDENAHLRDSLRKIHDNSKDQSLVFFESASALEYLP